MDNCGHFLSHSTPVSKNKSKFFEKTGRLMKNKEDIDNQSGMKEGTSNRLCR